MVVLQLKSTDPNSKNASPDEAVATVKKVLGGHRCAAVIWGTANVQKDEEVLKQISEAFQGEKLIMGPVEDKNHKGYRGQRHGLSDTPSSPHLPSM